MRPQRGSRATSSIGAKVRATPSCVASSAAARAVFSHRSGENRQASAKGTGKIVRWPWMTSRPKQERDAEAGFFHGQSLDVVRLLGAPVIEQVPDPPGPNPRSYVAELQRDR